MLVRISRGEFEEMVRKAARTARRQPEPPRLVQAHFRAKLLRSGLDDNALVGTAEWTIAHAGPGPGLLPLEPLDLALTNVRWTDNRPAVIGALDPRTPKSPALLVLQPGRQALYLDWSACGTPGPEQQRF